MAYDNEDPLHKFAQDTSEENAKLPTNNSEDLDAPALFKTTENDDDDDDYHSDNYSFWDFEEREGHRATEEEDPDKDPISQLTPMQKVQLDQQKTVLEQQKQDLRHQQNMDRLSEINAGLETSSNMINTFQDNAKAAIGNNENLERIAVETNTELKGYLDNITTQLLDENQPRKKSSPEEKDEVFCKINWLKDQIAKDMAQYRGWEKQSKKWALTFRLLSSALAALVTVLLGMNITDYMKSLGIDWIINFCALVISAFISIIGVIQSFFDVNELYIKYTDTANKLEELLETIGYLELGIDYVSLRQTNLLYKGYTKIIENTHEYEMKIRASGDQKSGIR